MRFYNNTCIHAFQNYYFMKEQYVKANTNVARFQYKN